LIAAVRGGAHQIWFAEGDYHVLGREFLYTRTKSHYDITDNLTSGVWAGLLVAPSYGGDTAALGHMKIYGGFVGGETSIEQRPSFTYQNKEGTDIGVKLMGSQIDSTTHFIGQRGLAPVNDPGILNFGDTLSFTEIQPDKLNLINQDTPTLRQPTLPSQGVNVIKQVEYAGRGDLAGEFRPLIDGVEVSNGFSAIYTNLLWNGAQDTLLNTSVFGGAGIFQHGGNIKNSYVHDNYDAVATFLTMYMSCGGGIFMTGGTIDSAVVINNVSETTGGGILLNGARLLNSYVANNYAFKEGGGVHTGSATNNASVSPEITNTVVTNNKTLKIPTEMFAHPSGNGGGIWMSDANSTKIQNTTVYGNSATGDSKTSGLGDNIYMAGGELTGVVSLGAEHAFADTERTLCYHLDGYLTVSVAGDCMSLYFPWTASMDVTISGTNIAIMQFLNSLSSNIVNGEGSYDVHIDVIGDDVFALETLFSAYLPSFQGTPADSTVVVHTNGHVNLSFWGQFSTDSLTSANLHIKVGGGSACSSAYDYGQLGGGISLNVSFDNNGHCVVFLPFEITSITDAKAFLDGRIAADSDVLFAYASGNETDGYVYDNYWTADELGVSDEWMETGTSAIDTSNSDIYVTNEALLDKITYSAALRVMGANGVLELGPTNIMSGLDDIDTVFADASKHNFRINGNSPLSGAGVLLGSVTHDIVGDQRRVADIGAYTFYEEEEEDDVEIPGTESDETEAEDELGVPNTGDLAPLTNYANLTLYVAGFATAGLVAGLALARHIRKRI
jgi:hypothetical protein